MTTAAAATNFPTGLSARARKAIDLLADGAAFVKRLERDIYTGREQFAHRMMMGNNIIKGFGVKVFYELHRGGWIISRHDTSVSTTYKLNTAH